MNALNNEGTTYEWFKFNTIGDWFLLCLPYSDDDSNAFDCNFGNLVYDVDIREHTVCPTFVIG